MATDSLKRKAVWKETSSSVLKKSDLSMLELTPFEEVDPELYADWYLKSCYPELPFHDEKLILEFLVSEVHKVVGASRLLEMGCGPTVSHAIPFVPHVDSIVLSDYLESNLNHIKEWVANPETGHQWSLHTAYVLQLEKGKATSTTVKEREDLFRKKLKTIIVGDLLSKRPIRSVQKFPVVSCFYATEQAASDEAEWLDVMQNLSSLILPGGHLFLACVHDTDFYAIHDDQLMALRIPIVPIKKRLIEKGLRASGFSLMKSEIHIKDVGGLKEEGLNEIALVSAVKTV